VENRERILDAARALFAAEGLDVPMRAVARRAGVGPATLYRRFPTKEALVTEAFAEQMQACLRIAEEGLADPDPWHGFCRVVERICEVNARDRGFTDAFLAAYPQAVDLAEHRGRTLRAVSRLARRAKEAGGLRPDFAVEDLIMMIMANRGLRAPGEPARIAASRRFAALVIQAFQASPGQAPLPPVPRLDPGPLQRPGPGQAPAPAPGQAPAPDQAPAPGQGLRATPA
jgi:AcrR family transcriptional regulator